MRILYFTRNYNPHDHRFLTALAETGHEIHFLPLIRLTPSRSEVDLPDHVHVEDGLQSADRIRWLMYPNLVQKLKSVLRKIKPDIIHAGPIHRSATVAALAGFHPLVSMSWGSDLLWTARSPCAGLATRFTLARTDSFIGDCQAVRRAAIKHGMPEARIVIFPWGVDLEHYSPGPGEELRTRLGWQEAQILLSTRTFEPLYGVDLIIKAFVRVGQEHPGLRLILLGDGSEKGSYQAQLKRAGMSDRVVFAGVVARQELPAYYRAADVYISASRSDGSSISLLESMACAKPAIVSDIPGNLEWVTPGYNGWTFHDGDLESLVVTLRNALQDQSRFPPMGSAARTTAEARADWSLNFPELLQAYDMAANFSRGY